MSDTSKPASKKVSTPIGTIKEFGGRQYIKTDSGWKYVGKGTGKGAKEHVASATASSTDTSSSKEAKPVDLATPASHASTEALTAAAHDDTK